MKYSKEKTEYHEQVIFDLVCRNPSVSTRELCYELAQQNIKLNRAYATKLMWRACRKLTQKQIDATERRKEFNAWKEELNELYKEIDALKYKLLDIIQSYPGDLHDPKNLERF
jgi:hypothetical protein